MSYDYALALANDRIRELEAERATLRAERDEARRALVAAFDKPRHEWAPDEIRPALQAARAALAARPQGGA